MRAGAEPRALLAGDAFSSAPLHAAVLLQWAAGGLLHCGIRHRLFGRRPQNQQRCGAAAVLATHDEARPVGVPHQQRVEPRPTFQRACCVQPACASRVASPPATNAAGRDLVVPTMSDADCCQACEATPGCRAWTMTPPSNCADRLPDARGCCFLKVGARLPCTPGPRAKLPWISLPGRERCPCGLAPPCNLCPSISPGVQGADSWTATKDSKGVLTSGVLL